MASDSDRQRLPSPQDAAAAEPVRTLRVFPPVDAGDGDRARLKLVEDTGSAAGIPVPGSESAPEPDYEKVPLEVLSGTAARATAAPEGTAPAAGKRCKLPSTPALIALAGAAVVLVSVPFLITGMWDDPKAGMSNEPATEVSGVPVLTGGPAPGPAGRPMPGAPSAPNALGGAPASGRSGDPAGVPGAGRPHLPARADAVFAGPGCANTARVSYQKVGEYAKGREGWNTYQGGSTEAGCSGVFDAVPMAGNADGSPDPQTYTKWLFDVSDVVTVGQCTVSAYIPNDTSTDHVGAVKAHYSVFHSLTSSADNVVGVADVDQTAHLGQWVSLGGPFKIDTGRLSVKLNNSGLDWNTGDGKTNYRHIASAQLKVSCSPS
ncbi:hypothetical protein [Amycolatopsis sp. NPDC058986]|uniref:hypothetical protein n=1 Tax=unclassified Amycolatopsis TaxID=2618356 RepID=UPI00366BBAAB